MHFDTGLALGMCISPTDFKGNIKNEHELKWFVGWKSQESSQESKYATISTAK